nr:hypothetical protein CFP56_36158 [Quercus suber]
MICRQCEHACGRGTAKVLEQGGCLVAGDYTTDHWTPSLLHRLVKIPWWFRPDSVVEGHVRTDDRPQTILVTTPGKASLVTVSTSMVLRIKIASLSRLLGAGKPCPFCTVTT